MVEFISQNAGTIIVGIVMLAIVAAIVIKLVRDRKSGGAGCACGCEGCGVSDDCGDKNSAG